MQSDGVHAAEIERGQPSPRMAQQFLHLVRGASLDRWRHVRIALLGEGELGVAKRLLDDLGVHVSSEHQACGGVPQVVEALARQSGHLEVALEPLRDPAPATKPRESRMHSTGSMFVFDASGSLILLIQKGSKLMRITAK